MSPTCLLPMLASSAPTPSLPRALVPPKPFSTSSPAIDICSTSNARSAYSRRELSISIAAAGLLSFTVGAARADSDDEYVKDTAEVISKVRSTINMDKSDPNVAAAVAELREVSNSWVAKYRREKSLIGRSSFRDMYSALNAVSGHYISFGPTAPIPAKRKARILEEMDTAEKALLRGR